MLENSLKTVLRLMVIQEPKEADLNYTSRSGGQVSRIKESLEAFLLGTGIPMTKIDLNINKYINGSQFRNVKLKDLLKTFIQNEDDLKSGRKVLLATVELLPIKNNYSESGLINRFEPYLEKFDIADPTTEDAAEIEEIKRIAG